MKLASLVAVILALALAGCGEASQTNYVSDPPEASEVEGLNPYDVEKIQEEETRDARIESMIEGY